MAGQLNLFKGKRQRGEAPPPPLEDDLHILLADILRCSCNPGWVWTYMPFGELRTKATAALLARKGVGRGWPDFMLAYAGVKSRGSGPFVFVEVKRPRLGRVSVEQAEMHRHLTMAGAAVIVSDDVKEIVKALRTLGVVRSAVA